MTRQRPRFAIVTTCMGRLEHIKQCAERLMADPRIGKNWSWTVVDYACPEKTGDWLEETYGDRVSVLRVLAPEDEAPIRVFHKPLALNSGAVRAIEDRPEFLVFLDADTLVTPRFLDMVEENASIDRFLIVEKREDKRDLTGFICVSYRHFAAIGGFDVTFEGWGAEDLDFRLRLFLQADIGFSEIPGDYADSVAHDDSLRTQNYREKSKDASHIENLDILCANVFRITKKHLLQHYQDSPKAPHLRRLLGVERFSPTELLLK